MVSFIIVCHLNLVYPYATKQLPSMPFFNVVGMTGFLFTMFVVRNVKKVCHFLPFISQSLIKSACKVLLKQVSFYTCSAL